MPYSPINYPSADSIIVGFCRCFVIFESRSKKNVPQGFSVNANFRVFSVNVTILEFRLWYSGSLFHFVIWLVNQKTIIRILIWI